MFIISIAILQSVLFLAHWVLYRSLVVFLNITNPSQIFNLKIALGILSLSFLAASLISFRYIDVVTRIIYTIASVWIGILLYLLLATLVISIIFGIASQFIGPSGRLMVAYSIFILSIVVSVYGIVNASVLRVKSISVDISGLPQEWEGRKAVWVSDIHLGQVRGESFAKEIVAKIQEQNPDAVFIGGDLYDGGAPADMVAEPFSELKSKYGTYFITGNHEEFFDKDIYIDALNKLGIRILDNEIVDLGGLNVAGVDYQDTTDNEKFQTVISKMDIVKGKSLILLKHVPSNLDVAKLAGVDFQISGHTHEGQLFPIDVLTHAIYKGYDYGLKDYYGMKVYISSGAGTWGPPMRIGTDPEIVVITFNKK